jgi:DNA-binding response OmpR family regulator
VATIAVIDDDPNLGEVLKKALESEGHTVEVACTAAEALVMIDAAPPELVLLDLTLPDADGLVLLVQLRERQPSASIPLIVLSGRNTQVDRVLGLKFGADDFVAKPFELDELLARINAVLRRARPRRTCEQTAPGELRSGSLVISTRRASVTYRGHPIALTRTEFRLLVALAAHPNEIVSREVLAKLVWGCADTGTSHMLDVHLGRLRAKLRAVAQPLTLETVRNQGFIWCDGAQFAQSGASDGTELDQRAPLGISDAA